MRMGPLVAIVVFVVVIGATLGTTLLWVIAGLSLFALCILLFVMARQNLFVGPRILVDDVKEKLDRAGREPEEEVYVAQVRRDGEEDR